VLDDGVVRAGDEIDLAQRPTGGGKITHREKRVGSKRPVCIATKAPSEKPMITLSVQRTRRAKRRPSASIAATEYRRARVALLFHT
jgi:hypothetical protein